MLTAETAIVMARQAMIMDGFDMSAWELYESRPAESNADGYVQRNAMNNNRCVLAFVSKEKQTCAVSVELHGDLVVCQVTRGK
jgi:hypothetical protein